MPPGLILIHQPSILLPPHPLGLERLAAEKVGSRLDIRGVIRKLLNIIEATLAVRSGLPSIGAVEVAMSKRGTQQLQQEEALLSVYVGALACLSLQAVAQHSGPLGESSALAAGGEEEPLELLWCEQPPLAMALGLAPETLARPVFGEASFFARTWLPCSPKASAQSLVTVQCPLLVSVFLESRCEYLLILAHASLCTLSPLLKPNPNRVSQTTTSKQSRAYGMPCSKLWQPLPSTTCPQQRLQPSPVRTSPCSPSSRGGRARRRRACWGGSSSPSTSSAIWTIRRMRRTWAGNWWSA